MGFKSKKERIRKLIEKREEEKKYIHRKVQEDRVCDLIAEGYKFYVPCIKYKQPTESSYDGGSFKPLQEDERGLLPYELKK